MDRSLKPEIYPLTGIRAAAALWVVLYHMRPLLTQCYPNLEFLILPLISHGYLGVDLFFILSGFIIFYNYADRLKGFRLYSICEFLWMRLARLWPVHATVLGLFVLLLWVQRIHGLAPNQPGLYTGSALLRNLLLIHSWAVPLQISWNVPAWSISCEWLAYLFFPLLIASRLCTASSWRAGAVAAAALIGTALMCQALSADGNASYGLVRIAGEFLGGCGLCKMFRAGVASRVPWKYLVPLAIAAVIAGSYFILPALGLVAYWCVPLLGIIVLGLAYHQCFVSRFFATRWMLFGGYVSYSLYMVHELALIVLKRTDARLGGFAPILDLVATTAAAVVLFYCVETPCRKLMRNVFPRHKQKSYPVI